MANGSASEVGAEVAATMRAMSAAVKSSTKPALTKVGKMAEQQIKAAAPTLRFRNHGGARLTVRTAVSGDELTVDPVGPWGILEPGAKRHIIRARRGRAMPLGRGIFRHGPFRHPGTRNTRAWSKGQEATFDKAEDIMSDVIGDAVEGAFGG